MNKNNLRQEGVNHCYLDIKQSFFSNVGVGLITRSVGHKLKVAYFNTKKNTFSLIDFFDKLHINNLDFYSFNSLDVSFLNEYDLIIFDNFSIKELSFRYIEEFLDLKSERQEVVFVCNNEDDYNLLFDRCDLVSKFVYDNSNKEIKKLGNNELSKKGIYSNNNNNNNKEKRIAKFKTCIYGNGKGKSTYSFGFILRKLIDGNLVKLVYFDKGGNFYGEKLFFEKVKLVYRKFQMYSFGNVRFDGTNFRFENNENDFKEARYALDELERSYHTQIIVAEEINTCFGSGLLTEDIILEKLKGLENEILITGRCSSQKLLDICNNKIEVVEVKHYSNDGKGVREGIDF